VPVAASFGATTGVEWGWASGLRLPPPLDPADDAAERRHQPANELAAARLTRGRRVQRGPPRPVQGTVLLGRAPGGPGLVPLLPHGIPPLLGW